MAGSNQPPAAVAGATGHRSASLTENSASKVTLSFGRNWQEFVERALTQEREQSAMNSLKRFLELEDLCGRSFLDVGSGSGIFLPGVFRLGARQVVSFDIDLFSVHCCEHMREKAGSPANWKVAQGSVLDAAFLTQFEKADIAYAWGSLHHTGAMWQAIHNAAEMVAPGGLFYVAIYNKVPGRGGSEFWLEAKKFYNASSKPVKLLFETTYFLRYHILPQLISLKNAVAYFHEYSKRRGMSYWIDIRDWLGGYPYEFASAEEILRFCREFGMELVNLRTTHTVGMNELLFRKKS